MHSFSPDQLIHQNGNLVGGKGPPIGNPNSNGVSKKSSSRRNAWGNLSYADLITNAINSSPEKRLTLSQVYDWMVQNIDYFKDKETEFLFTVMPDLKPLKLLPGDLLY